jgi:hypothetical protein
MMLLAHQSFTVPNPVPDDGHFKRSLLGQFWRAPKTFSDCSNRDPFNLVERDCVARPVVELRRAWRFVVRYRLGVLDRAAVLEVRGNSSCTEDAIDALAEAEDVLADFANEQFIAF